jgi:hypothetical protein
VLDKYTTEKQSSVALFLSAKRDNANYIHKEFFSVCGAKCLLRKAVHNWVENSPKGVRKSQMMPGHVRKWLKQQSKDFYSVDIDALLKPWNKCINVVEGYVEK